MISQTRQYHAPFPRAVLFDIAQDVEHYPAFLPHCIAARILDKSSSLWRVQNVYRWGPVSYKFSTLADVRPATYIHITSAPSEPIQLNVKWVFETVEEALTNVTFEIGFASRVPLLEKLVQAMLSDIAQQTETAFLQRAEQLMADRRV